MRFTLALFVIITFPVILCAQTYTTTSQGKNTVGGAYVAPVITKTYSFKYSDGSTAGLGGYSDPLKYKFSGSASGGGVSSEAAVSNNGGSKRSKKDEKQLRIDMIENGLIWTRWFGEDWKENSSRRAYQQMLKLVDDKRYGEALDLAQKEVNTRYTDKNPDGMSEYRYMGLMIYIFRECLIKYPTTYPSTHLKDIEDAKKRVEASIKNSAEANNKAYRLKIYLLCGLYEQANNCYAEMNTAKETADDALVLDLEFNRNIPNKEKIVTAMNHIVDERLKVINNYKTDPAEASKRSVDESALGYFFTDFLYNLTIKKSAITGELLPDLQVTRSKLISNFKTEEGKQRFALIGEYFKELGSQ
ncbi:MAG: hypothetical protein ABIO55_04630 [Ginsengibacter sp.]